MLIRRLKTFKIDADTNGNGSAELDQTVLPLKFSRMTVAKKVYNYSKEDINSGSIINYLKINGNWIEENVTKKFPHHSHSSWSGVRQSEKRSILVDIDIPVINFYFSYTCIYIQRFHISGKHQNDTTWTTS